MSGSSSQPPPRALTYRLPALLVLVPCIVLSTACIWIFQSGSVEELDPADAPPTVLSSPVKAFLPDGSVAVFPQGAEITRDSIRGDGSRYSLGLTDTTALSSLPLDSLLGIEAFRGQVDPGRSFLVSTLSTVGVVVGIPVLAAAIFGSCPTLYASPSHGGTLQAEAFSYSIAPLLEGRDVDAMAIGPDADGILRLELRNEALETHYINHLEVLSVEHGTGVVVLPDQEGRLLGVGSRIPPTAAADRDGRSVRSAISERDGLAFSSSEERLRTATGSDSRDQLTLTFPRPHSDSAVVVLRLRNSLLTTVLFYDVMLGAAGAGAVDWLGRDLERVQTVVELARWYRKNMGLFVEVYDGSKWRMAGRVADTGPIAWETVGVRLPVHESDSLRVRLGFLADEWRIDDVYVGVPVPISPAVHVPVARALLPNGDSLPAAVQRLAHPDDAYLTTYPGTSVLLEFEVPASPSDGGASYILSSQGYYTEWIRPDWIRSTAAPRTFRPGEEAIETLLALWRQKKDAYEASFFSSRIPVP